MSAIPFEIRVQEARVSFARRPFLRPLRLSSGEITEITEARAEVVVERPNGRTTRGKGAIYLSDLWAWPAPSRTPSERDAALRTCCETIAASFPSYTGGGKYLHPLEAGLRLHQSVLCASTEPPDLPPLARLICASPFDAALHDAAGRAYGVSAFALYDQEASIPSADVLFPAGDALVSIRNLLQAPRDGLTATLVVGKGDALSEIDSWVRDRGYHCFKLKVGGTDPGEDSARVSAVFRHVRALGVATPRLTVDANCASPGAATVMAFLDALEAHDPEAYAALEAVEQPTGRNIRAQAFDWRAVAARKPLLLDEGLTDLDLLPVAEAQGWNGLAVKTCRGHSFSLVSAAWAHQRGWKLTMMDLTNPGIAAIHSALFAAHLPGVDAIEMNAPQYTPAANADWLPRLQPLLAPQDGVHRLPAPLPIGLGTTL